MVSIGFNSTELPQLNQTPDVKVEEVKELNDYQQFDSDLTSSKGGKRDDEDTRSSVQPSEVVPKSLKHLFTDRQYAINTAVLSLVWSSSAYAFYFTEFYMKYVPVQNIYYLAMMMGLSDMLTSIGYMFLQKFFTVKYLITVCSGLLSVSSLIMAVSISIKPPSEDGKQSLML